MIAPATSQIVAKFGITSDVEATMVTSIFVLAYAFGPLFLGPLSELYGRSHVLQLANLIYLGEWRGRSVSAQLISRLCSFQSSLRFRYEYRTDARVSPHKRFRRLGTTCHRSWRAR